MSNAIPAAAAGSRPVWSLADRLRKAREQAGLEQGELASICGISRATISAAENGHRHPSRATVAMWAMATGVSRAWLLGGDGGPDTGGAQTLALARFAGLMAVIGASGNEAAPGHVEAQRVLDAVSAREAEVQARGDWEASSSIHQPEVLAWCRQYRPQVAEEIERETPPSTV